MTTYVARLLLPVSDRDHIRGPGDALATLLEYGDFECPFCGAAYPVVEEVRRLAGNQLRFAYRHFPLTAVHPHAEGAAEAAEAAGAQGQFWPMHDRLFENQHALDAASLIERARALRLDLPRFVRDVTGRVFAPRVREDFMSGVRSGVNGTPTFFINDVRYDGPHDVASLYRAVTLAAHR